MEYDMAVVMKEFPVPATYLSYTSTKFMALRRSKSVLSALGI
jgi:hypothetical protein